MYVKRGDIPAISKALGLAMVDMKADTVMLPRNGAVLPMNMYYHSEDLGWRNFMVAQPDISRFEAVDAVTLFSLLHSIESSRVPGRPVMRAGKASAQLIDLSSMLEDLSIMADVHFAMKNVWRGLGTPGRKSSEVINVEIVDGIKADLCALCKDDFGLTEAKRLWAIYESVIGPEVPSLTVRPGSRLSTASGRRSGIQLKDDEPGYRSPEEGNRRGRSLR